MHCPYCRHDNETGAITSTFLMFICSNCGNIYQYKNSSDVEYCSVGTPFHNFLEVTLPNFKIGDSVMCIDSRHGLFLQDGFVRELDHLHARILFKWNKLIWMGQDIIAKMPG